jgi:hypothetical protein
LELAAASASRLLLELDPLLRDLFQLKLKERKPLRFLGDGFPGFAVSCTGSAAFATETELDLPL